MHIDNVNRIFDEISVNISFFQIRSGLNSHKINEKEYGITRNSKFQNVLILLLLLILHEAWFVIGFLFYWWTIFEDRKTRKYFLRVFPSHCKSRTFSIWPLFLLTLESSIMFLRFFCNFFQIFSQIQTIWIYFMERTIQWWSHFFFEDGCLVFFCSFKNIDLIRISIKYWKIWLNFFEKLFGDPKNRWYRLYGSFSIIKSLILSKSISGYSKRSH